MNGKEGGERDLGLLLCSVCCAVSMLALTYASRIQVDHKSEVGASYSVSFAGAAIVIGVEQVRN